MKPRGLHTDEDTISLLRRLAVHYPDDMIAGVLNLHGLLCEGAPALIWARKAVTAAS